MRLIVGDLHSCQKNIEVLEEVLTKCKKLALKCTETIFLGDLNDGKSTIKSQSIEQFIRFFKDWPTPIICLVGNHCLVNSLNPEMGHSLEFLKLLSNVTIVDKPILIDDTFYIPYMPEDQFKTLKLQKADYCCIHQDINGLKYSSGSVIEHGQDSKIFAQYKRVLGGHIHLPSEIDNIVIVGTPYTASYGEANEDKRVVILNPENNKIVSAPINVRKHLSFEYSIDSIDDIKNIKLDLKSKITEQDLVRVVINVPSEIEHKIKKSLFKDTGVDVLKTKAKQSNKSITMDETMTNVDIMEKYLKTVQMNDDCLKSVLEKNRQILLNII